LTEPPPLALYIHWPYCARICPYCDFNVVRDRGRLDEQMALVEAIERDIAAQAALIGKRRLVSIFFGGGTPSLMAPEWTGRLISAARALFDISSDLEISLEANPTDAEAGRFGDLAAAGVDRLSLGVEAFDDDALRFLGRNHDAAAARRALETAIGAFPRVSLDLIYALPGQTPADWTATLQTAVASGAEHISPYQLTIERGTAFDRQVRRGSFTPLDADAEAALYETTQGVLNAAGFEAYEVSNHASGPAARSRHNLAYWRGYDYIGAGPGAHGRLSLEGGRIATEAHRGIAAYIDSTLAAGVGFAARETLSPREAAIERALMGLRTVEGVSLTELAALSLDNADDLVRDGFLARTEGSLFATAKGRTVLDRVTADLCRP